MDYYDLRNRLHVNAIRNCLPDKETLSEWWFQKITEAHIRQDFTNEYMMIKAMDDFLKGMEWLENTDGSKLDERLRSKVGVYRLEISVYWRSVKNKLLKGVLE